MNEIRVVLGASRAAVAEDHLWARSGHGLDAATATPALLETVPVADAYTVVVPAERVVFRRIALPAGARARALAAIPFVLEDSLVEAPEHYECVVVDDASTLRAGAPVLVAVLERDWLAAARQSLARIDRGAVRWVVEGWGWPGPADGGWLLRIDARGALLRRGWSVARLAAGSLEAGLGLALAEPGALRPPSLGVDAGGDAGTAQRVQAWAARHGLAATPCALPDPWRESCPADGPSLFRQTRSRTGEALRALGRPARWRAVAVVAAVLAVVELLGLAAGWASLESRVAGRQKEAVELYRAVAGANAAVVDPLLQMRRLHRTRSHAGGQATADDFLPLLAALGDLLPREAGRLGEIGYEDGRLRLVVQRPRDATGASFDAALRTLRGAGYRVDAVPSPDGSRWTLSVGRS